MINWTAIQMQNQAQKARFVRQNQAWKLVNLEAQKLVDLEAEACFVSKIKLRALAKSLREQLQAGWTSWCCMTHGCG